MKRNNNRKYRPLWITIVVIVLLSNTPPAAWILQPAYHYQTKNGAFSFQEIPGKGLDFKNMKYRFQDYLDANPNSDETQLYRTFTFKPWQFWQWWEMIVRNSRFRLPYLEPAKT